MIPQEKPLSKAKQKADIEAGQAKKQRKGA